ncbi:MAG TPA: PEP/pyruvate-binding domain-containing protein, partial [Ktedonobacteraceae bacterium]|nr:PEP/pyruvate-binding domain-containing protein [Ktedonobacteraceae bacterium]
MNLSDQEQEQLSIGNIQMNEAPLVLPFEAIKSELISLVGGKAANLGEMIQAGLPVPPGFCVTTTAYKRIAQGAHLDALLDELAVTPSSDSRHAHIIAEIRSFLLDVPMPDEVANAIAVAYQALGQGTMVAVAVRSSATAEDLPFASFAGQQETYLNIVGIEDILKAVSRCWASLWTDRSVSYRESLDIDSRTVQLAVVIQQLVDVSVAGVLFTANPLTGHRAQAVIDASPGLGEAVVSGAVNPDHFVVSRPIGEIIERRPGDKRVIIQARKEGGTERIDLPVADTRSCLSDQQIRALTALGAQVEAHYGAPQDIEWAIDTSGKFWLTQTRAITTLYPLPSDAPTEKDNLRVYFSVNVAQGVYRPLTPMGLGVFHLLASSVATFIGLPPRDLLAGPAPLKDAGMRLFVDVTPALRSRAGRKLVIRAMQAMESRTARIFQYIAHDSRLSFLPASDFRLLRTFLFVMVRSRLPLRIAMALFKPANARRHLHKLMLDLQAQTTLADGTSAVERVATVERLLFETMPRVFVGIIPTMLGALGAYSFASKLL